VEYQGERAKPRKTRGGPNAVDVFVGARVRQRRTLLGMSQERLGEALDLTFQQVQKYERGANRIGAGRLFELSRVLDVPIAYFFEGAPDVVRGGAAPPPGASEGGGTYEADTMSKRETLVLARAYYAITEPLVRRRVLELIKSLANGDEPAED
jgi:transcriptional regulator with XRE-family HTH domain